MLDRDETQRLISLAQKGDEAAKRELVVQNSPLVKSILRRYRNKGVEYDDLFQLGCIGLLKAIANFSETFDVRFSTYAVPMIAGEIKRYLRDDGYVKVSRSTKSLACKIAYFTDEFKLREGRSPTLEEITGGDKTDDEIDKIIIKEGISKLSERERKIILLRYYRDKTQSEVARELNVSQVQISRLESRIIEKLRAGFD